MSAFQSVNAALAPAPSLRAGDETNPTTPRPDSGSSAPSALTAKLDDAKTPTKASFGALSAQKPLPESPFPDVKPVPGVADEKKAHKRGGSQYSTKSRDSEDVDMDDSEEDDDGSDVESVAADGTRTMKKKKSQRFFCTDYPPCNLSFTRSEHLARHIRKHTGERPFQCHCSRRFSRLDNLRQHAQTVHVNEEIPGDSLAATGTRFQRQIRTDRVRPPGNRSRANTGGSQSSQPRGHTRNSLSASSISSIGSIYGNRDEIRRRPPPLVMATDPRTRLSFESYPSTDGQYPSSGGFSTPTSARYSTGYDSPQWSSTMGSPIRSHSRTASIYAGHRTPGRRLSVPSAENPFQSAQGFGPSLAPLNSGNRESFSPSGSMLASPTSSVGSGWSRRESLSSVSAADDYRRRTWHYPESNQGFTSRLQSVMTPGYYQPSPPQAGVSSTQITLPGIESFDPLPRPVTPPRRNPSPMMIDTPSRGPMHPLEYSRPEERTSAMQWENNLPRNFTRLEIAQNTSRPDDASTWASDVNRAVQDRAQQAQAEPPRAPPRVSFGGAIYPSQDSPARNPHHISAPPLTPRESKRQGWYAGPLSAQRQRISPAGSSSSENGVPGTPNSVANPDYNPVIVQPGSWDPNRQRPIERAAPPAYSNFPAAIEQAYAAYETARPPPQEQKSDNSMLRLEALVAVATGERENAAAAAY